MQDGMWLVVRVNCETRKVITGAREREIIKKIIAVGYSGNKIKKNGRQ